jgi:hypothetical protein
MTGLLNPGQQDTSHFASRKVYRLPKIDASWQWRWVWSMLTPRSRVHRYVLALVSAESAENAESLVNQRMSNAKLHTIGSASLFRCLPRPGM